jgi:hypothetical protein
VMKLTPEKRSPLAGILEISAVFRLAMRSLADKRGVMRQLARRWAASKKHARPQLRPKPRRMRLSQNSAMDAMQRSCAQLEVKRATAAGQNAPRRSRRPRRLDRAAGD